jgi:hypothetical protein
MLVQVKCGRTMPKGSKTQKFVTSVRERAKAEVAKLSPRKRPQVIEDALAQTAEVRNPIARDPGPRALSREPPATAVRPVARRLESAFEPTQRERSRRTPRATGRVGPSRRDSTIGDAIKSDTPGRGQALDRDWNGAQQVHELKRLNTGQSEASELLRGLQENTGDVSSRMGELNGVVRDAAEAQAGDADKTRHVLGRRIDAAADQARRDQAKLRQDVGMARLQLGTIGQELRTTREDAARQSTQVTDRLDQMSDAGTRARAAVVTELRGQRRSLDGAAATLDQILAQGASLSPDAIAAASQAVESDPALQQLVNDGMLKWQDLLRPDGTLDMQRVAAVRSKLATEQQRKDAQYAKTFARFSEMETRPGARPIGNGYSLTFPAMWSDTAR